MLFCLLLAGAASTPRAPAGIADLALGQESGLGKVLGVRVEPALQRLVVEWQPVRDAEGYKVQWKSRSQAYHRSRQATTRRTAYTITRLVVDRRYQVRVIATAEGVDDGPPSDEVTGTPLPNEPPQAVGTLPALRLGLGESTTVDMTRRFSDPNDDLLRYTVRSADPAKVSATIDGAVVTVAARGHGETTVTVTATDPDGLSATQTFGVAAGNLLGFVDRTYAAAEGGMLSLAVELSVPRNVDTVLAYSVGTDDDAATADADADDFAARTGTAVIVAGAKRGTIEIPIVDDDSIEAPRETLVVTLDANEEDADYALWSAGRAVSATIEEGVCDRTPAVRDKLRAWRACQAVTARVLAAHRTLDLRQRALESLKEDDFAGLEGLRALLLDGNGLHALPERVFEGLANLRQLHLQDNPGAPFPLTVSLFRTNAPVAAPPPAWIAARVREAAPFAIRLDLAIEGAALSTRQTVVAAGATKGRSILVRSPDNVVRAMVAEAPAIPSTRCGALRQRCFQGLEARAGDPLVLFKAPPRATAAIGDRRLIALADSVRLDMSAFFTAADDAALTFSASSSEPGLALVTVVGDILVVTPNSDGEDGVATITVTATDGDGLSASATFRVSVAFVGRRFFRGWRLTLAP